VLCDPLGVLEQSLDMDFNGQSKYGSGTVSCSKSGLSSAFGWNTREKVFTIKQLKQLVDNSRLLDFRTKKPPFVMIDAAP
jgi:hypothetical protein